MVRAKFSENNDQLFEWMLLETEIEQAIAIELNIFY